MPVASAGEPDRVIAIGDLNGAIDLLRVILRGLDIIDEDDRWCGARACVIQLGDVFDRGGGGACAAFQLLQTLGEQARASGGQVTQLLGNHEVMAALGDDRWCTTEEYLAFASSDELDAWPAIVEHTRADLVARHPGLPDAVVDTLLESWKRLRAPGRSALASAIAEDGPVGRGIRTLPIAVIARQTVFCHAGLLPEWAILGLDGVERERQKAWDNPRVRSNIFHHERGPLWNRFLSLRDESEMSEPLRQSLSELDVRRMVVGHTPTGHVPGGRSTEIALRCDGQLVCIDVGLRPGHPGAALLIDDDGGFEWTPDGRRQLWAVDV